MAETERLAGGARRPIAFISHHSSQDETARHLKTVLERNGVTGWMAPDDIEPGLPFDRAIVEQVRRSDLILLLFCARSDQSKHVKREVMLAEDHNKLIYPVRLEAIEPAGLAYWLQAYQWVDWIDRRDATIERMIAAIKRQIAAADAAAAAPPADVEPPAVADTAPVDSKPPAPVARETVAPLAPLPLASTGARDGEPPRSGRGVGLGRNGWIGVAVIAVLALLLIGLAIGGGLGASDDADERERRADLEDRNEGGNDSDGDEDEGSDPRPDEDPGPLSEYVFLQPGQWRTSMWIDRIDAPALPPEALAAMQAQQGAMGSSTEDCMTPAEAADMRGSLAAVEDGSQCSVPVGPIGNGRIDVVMTCQNPTVAVPVEMRLAGSYTPSELTLDATMSMDMGAQGGMLTMQGVVTGERIGECAG